LRRFYVILAVLIAAASCGKRLPTQVPQPANSLPRRAVAELFTATWCSNCPEADRALEDLWAGMGDSLTIIEYHTLTGTPQDPLANSYSQERGQFYGVNAWPTLWCDGVSSQVGTDPDPSQSYAILARNRLLLNSPVGLDIRGRIDGASINYSVSIDPRTSSNKTNLRLLVLVLEDSVYYSAPNQLNVHRMVCRMIDPSPQGLPLELIPGVVQLRQGTMPLDTVNWRKGRLWLAAFIQSFSDREILQSDMLNLSLPVWDFTFRAADTIKTVSRDSLARYAISLRNDGNQPDTFWVDMPDSLSLPPELIRQLLDNSGGPLPRPAGFYLNPGDSTGFLAAIASADTGWFRAGLTVRPARQPALAKAVNLHIKSVRQVVYDFRITAPDTILIAGEGELAEFPVVIKNTGNQADSIYLDLPDSLLAPPGMDRSLCDSRGLCYPIPLGEYLAPGDSLANLVVHLQSSASGSCQAYLTLTSKSSPGLVRRLRLILEVVK
jgi:hypothetical protein